MAERSDYLVIRLSQTSYLSSNKSSVLIVPDSDRGKDLQKGQLLSGKLAGSFEWRPESSGFHAEEVADRDLLAVFADLRHHGFVATMSHSLLRPQAPDEPFSNQILVRTYFFEKCLAPAAQGQVAAPSAAPLPNAQMLLPPPPPPPPGPPPPLDLPDAKAAPASAPPPSSGRSGRSGGSVRSVRSGASTPRTPTPSASTASGSLTDFQSPRHTDGGAEEEKAFPTVRQLSRIMVGQDANEGSSDDMKEEMPRLSHGRSVSVGGTAPLSDRNAAFFEDMRRRANEAEALRLVEELSMDPEERQKLLDARAAKQEHEERQKRHLKRLGKAYTQPVSALRGGRGGRGRGRGRKGRSTSAGAGLLGRAIADPQNRVTMAPVPAV